MEIIKFRNRNKQSLKLCQVKLEVSSKKKDLNDEEIEGFVVNHFCIDEDFKNNLVNRLRKNISNDSEISRREATIAISISIF